MSGRTQRHKNTLPDTPISDRVGEAKANEIASAQDLVDVLRKRGCTYHDAKAALSKADTILERAILKAKV